jgi:hypothetical protein
MVSILTEASAKLDKISTTKAKLKEYTTARDTDSNTYIDNILNSNINKLLNLEYRFTQDFRASSEFAACTARFEEINKLHKKTVLQELIYTTSLELQYLTVSYQATTSCEAALKQAYQISKQLVYEQYTPADAAELFKNPAANEVLNLAANLFVFKLHDKLMSSESLETIIADLLPKVTNVACVNFKNPLQPKPSPSSTAALRLDNQPQHLPLQSSTTRGRAPTATPTSTATATASTPGASKIFDREPYVQDTRPMQEHARRQSRERGRAQEDYHNNPRQSRERDRSQEDYHNNPRYSDSTRDGKRPREQGRAIQQYRRSRSRERAN